MKKLLVTGFEPFDGRPVNASWLAAELLVAKLQAAGWNAEAGQLPVRWDRTSPELLALLEQHRPQTVLALGEGKPGCFQVEYLACNRHRQRADNAGKLPGQAQVRHGGPAFLSSGGWARNIRNHLVSHGLPALGSLDAGGYLCDEAFYTLQSLALADPGLQQVAFMHLPPYGTRVVDRDGMRPCDEALLEELADIMVAVLSES